MEAIMIRKDQKGPIAGIKCALSAYYMEYGLSWFAIREMGGLTSASKVQESMERRIAELHSIKSALGSNQEGQPAFKHANKLMTELLYLKKIGNDIYGKEKMSFAESAIEIAKSDMEEIARACSAKIIRIEA
ncbi:MAG: hypothetical protein ACP5RM_02305 [Candidatus Micrarchaeia archaeon]